MNGLGIITLSTRARSEPSWPFFIFQVIFFPGSLEMSHVLLPKVLHKKNRKSGGSWHPFLPFPLRVGCANLLLLGTVSCTYGMFLEEMCLHHRELTRAGLTLAYGLPDENKKEGRRILRSPVSRIPNIETIVCIRIKDRFRCSLILIPTYVEMWKTLRKIWGFHVYYGSFAGKSKTLVSILHSTGYPASIHPVSGCHMSDFSLENYQFLFYFVSLELSFQVPYLSRVRDWK